MRYINKGTCLSIINIAEPQALYVAMQIEFNFNWRFDAFKCETIMSNSEQ